MYCLAANSNVSNRKGQSNFSGQRDRSSFIALSQDKGTTRQAQNLAKGRDRTACQNPGRDRTACQNPGRDAGWYQISAACPFTSCGTKRDRAEKDVLKQEKDFLQQRRMVLNRKITFFQICEM